MLGRAAGRTRKWVWSVSPSLGLAVRVARDYAACDGGGRWRVYGTRVAGVGAGTVEVVLGRRLAEGQAAPTGLMTEQKLRGPGLPSPRERAPVAVRRGAHDDGA